MAEGIDNAAIFCCFLTPEYEQSLECHTELKYAKQKSVKIIPCIITDLNLWKYSEWLTSIIRNLEPVPFYVFQDISDISDAIDWLLYYMKNDASSYINLPSSIASKSNYLFEIIKYEYQRNNRIERLINPAQSFSIEQSYINLVIVNTKDQLEKEKQMDKIQHSDAIMGTYEDIYGVKTTIEIKDILTSCKGDKKQIVVFGRAGIGKSTFCRYIAYQWAKGSYWQEYELVALLPLRRLTTNRYPSSKEYTLVDLVIKEVFSFELSNNEEQIFKEQFDAKKTLWILDGYDEIIGNIPPHLECLFGKLLNTPHHILTSRPYLNTLSYAVQMEITGFTDKNITEYIHQFFELIEEKSENDIIKKNALLKFLRSKQSIWGIAHIPVNLELICSVWSNQDLSEIRHLTITTLYTAMTEWLCRRHLMLQSSKIQILSKKKLYENCHKEITFLETLAFHAMKNNTIIIQPRLLNKIIEETQIDSEEDYPKILKIGLLKSFDKGSTGNQLELEKDHYFIHLSFQEYFAARYLIHALNDSKSEEAKVFINHQKYNQRYALVFQFISGLISETHSQPKVEMFWNIILGEPLDMVGIRHMQLVISCLDAASGITTIPSHSELLKRIANYIQHCILQSSEYEINSNQIMQHFKAAESVINNDILLEMFISLLKHGDTNINRQTLVVLRHLNISNQLDTIRTLIANYLSHQDPTVRKCACEVLRKMGEKAATNEVIGKLVSALRDHDYTVRQNAYEALGKMGEKAATHEVIGKLVSALRDHDFTVRQSACGALVNIGKKAVINEVIKQLVSALGDQNQKVRESAYKTLAKMGEKAATNEVINQLVTALEDQDYKVRQNACETLDKMRNKVATNEVINKLVSALVHQDDSVRQIACVLLSDMGEKAATNEVINQLVSLLANQDCRVRERACAVLCKLGGNAATDKVITRLLSALEGQNVSVTWNACLVLGDMGEKAAKNAVIKQLLIVLEHQNCMVRGCACVALGQMGEKAATDEVVNKLLSALRDPDDSVRRRACIALGKIGEKAATNEITNELVSALGDQGYMVRESAREALVKMSEKAATNELINKLISVLQDQNQKVREIACVLLGDMGEKVATDEVINQLVSALEDQGYMVRRRACEALGKMGEKAAKNEVIHQLVVALTDNEYWVRRSACEALGKMGEKAATNEVIDKFISGLRDHDYTVRQNACEALGKMGEKAVTNEVIDKLVSALGDQNCFVRQRVCIVLGRMGKKAATDEVINRLSIAREDENYLVRQNAREALVKMGEKAATNEVIDKLISALRDDDYRVRQNACEALVNIGEKAAANEVIDKLISGLRDHDYTVRQNACEALGKMGEKAATNEVISTLLEIMKNGKDNYYNIALRTICNLLRRTSILERLDSKLILEWYKLETDYDVLVGISLEELIKSFGFEGDSNWRFVLMRCAFLRGAALIECGNEFLLYDKKEPISSVINDCETREDLKKNCRTERERLHLAL